MGRLAEARTIIHRLRAITPEIVPTATHLLRPEDRELFLSGPHLAAAAWPELTSGNPARFALDEA